MTRRRRGRSPDPKVTEPKRNTYPPKGPRELGFPRGATALLVIDPVNDFLSEGGAAWDMTKGTVEKNDVVASLARTVAGARARGVPVIFGPWNDDPQPFVWTKTADEIFESIARYANQRLRTLSPDVAVASART